MWAAGSEYLVKAAHARPDREPQPDLSSGAIDSVGLLVKKWTWKYISWVHLRSFKYPFEMHLSTLSPNGFVARDLGSWNELDSSKSILEKSQKSLDYVWTTLLWCPCLSFVRSLSWRCTDMDSSTEASWIPNIMWVLLCTNIIYMIWLYHMNNIEFFISIQICHFHHCIFSPFQESGGATSRRCSKSADQGDCWVSIDHMIYPRKKNGLFVQIEQFVWIFENLNMSNKQHSEWYKIWTECFEW